MCDDEGGLIFYGTPGIGRSWFSDGSDIERDLTDLGAQRRQLGQARLDSAAKAGEAYRAIRQTARLRFWLEDNSIDLDAFRQWNERETT